MEKGTKRRYSAAQMELLIREWEQSGQSRGDFCRGVGIPLWKFQYWLRRCREQGAGDTVSGFTEIRVKSESLSAGVIRIRHISGTEVELSSETSALYLRALLGW